mmetsp:Transcript_107135/g.194994  ORF Transcript_107135/g.194994 Transcript_107135/m.194994 type:complete len:238 (+) Transcript_107135:49-762(+)
MARSSFACSWQRWAGPLVVAGALLSGLVGRCSAAVDKKVVSIIQCEVCKHAVKTAHSYKKDNTIVDEDDIAELVDGLCSVKQKVGRWTAKIDITRESATGPFTLVQQEDLGYCKAECTAVQRACQNAFKGLEEDFTDMLKAEKSVKSMRQKLCKKTCSKKIPPIPEQWKDEAFSPRDQKEVETEDMMADMKAKTGMGMKMYKREDLMSMSEGDMETMAAREAFGQQRMAAKAMRDEM